VEKLAIAGAGAGGQARRGEGQPRVTCPLGGGMLLAVATVVFPIASLGQFVRRSKRAKPGADFVVVYTRPCW